MRPCHDDAMNALTDVAPEVKFRERMRGYDPVEVDRYVHVAGQRAAQAEERIRELEMLLAQAEAQAGRADSESDMRETLLRTLVLAQRTADAAISEAQSEAQALMDSAREQASQTLSEAETKASELLRSAEDRAARVLSESESRVTEIDARLNTERNTLRGLAESFQAFVQEFEQAANFVEDDGRSFGDGSADAADFPVTWSESRQSATEATSSAGTADPETEKAETAQPETAQSEAAQVETAQPEASESSGTESVEHAESAAYPESVEVVEGIEGVEYVGGAAEPRTDLEQAGPPTMPYEFDMDELFGGGAVNAVQEEPEDDEFIEQLRQVVTSDAPQPSADAAIAAFFDSDDKARSAGGPPAGNGKLGYRA